VHQVSFIYKSLLLFMLTVLTWRGERNYYLSYKHSLIDMKSNSNIHTIYKMSVCKRGM